MSSDGFGGIENEQMQVLARQVLVDARVAQLAFVELDAGFFAQLPQCGGDRRLAVIPDALRNVPVIATGCVAQQQHAGFAPHDDAAAQ